MASLQSGQLETFINITGASESEAREKLQACRGDLNAAIDSYLTEKENSVASVRIEEADMSNWMDEEEPISRHQRVAQPFYPLPSPPTWPRVLSNLRGFGFERTTASRFPNRGTSPVVTQPRDVREIPIDWKDEEPRVQSSSGLVIEEIPATAESSLPSQTHPHFVSHEDEALRPDSPTFRRNEPRSRSGGNTTVTDLNTRQRRAASPLVDEVTDVLNINENIDIEDEMLKAALEASKKDATGAGVLKSTSGTGSDLEDVDFMRAVSLSLKTAEEERALREKKGFEDSRVDTGNSRDSVEETELEDQPLLRRRAGEALKSVPGLHQELRNTPGSAWDPSKRNSEASKNDEEPEKQKPSRCAALPEEPKVDNENAVAIMVRFPDGARIGRRFLKSEPLQCLLDFIDVRCGPLPGTYQLVRPYPRKAFTDAECRSSFQDLGLNSKYETLFLEVM